MPATEFSVGLRAAIAAISATPLLVVGWGTLTVSVPSKATPMPPLAPGCTLWKLNSDILAMEMSNGQRYQVPWSGSTVGTGQATYSDWPGLDFVGTGNAFGGANGSGRIDFTIAWIDNSGRVFVRDHVTGEIDPESGRARGVVARSDGPKFDWTTSSWFDCTAHAPYEPKPEDIARERGPIAGSGPAPPQSPAPTPAAKQGPTVSWDPIIGGLVAHITDRSGDTSQCTYTSEFYSRSFPLNANSTFDLRIVPAIPRFQNWDVTISCDNGTKTQTTTFF